MFTPLNFRLSLLNKLLLGRFCKVFITVFCGINGIMFMMNFTKISNRLFNMSFAEILEMTVLILPFFMFETLQYVLIVTIFLTLYEFFVSNELSVLKSLGISEKMIMKGVGFITIITFCLSILLEIIFPITIKRHISSKMLYESAGILNTLKKNTFNDFGDYIVIFKNIEHKNNIKDLILVQRKDDHNTVIVSKNGEIGVDQDGQILLNLQDVNFVKFNKDQDSFNYSKNASSQVSFESLTKQSTSGHEDDRFSKMLPTVKLYQRCKIKNKNCIDFFRRLIVPLQLITIGLHFGFSLVKKNNVRVDRRFLNLSVIIFLVIILSLTNLALPILIKYKLGSTVLFVHLFLIGKIAYSIRKSDQLG